MSTQRSSVRRTLELIRPYRWSLLRALVLLIGLTCGFIFSLPALLLIFVAWRRRERQIGTQGQYHALERHQPPVVIVPPVTSPQLPHYQPQHWSEADDLPLLPNKREFTVIGEED